MYNKAKNFQIMLKSQQRFKSVVHEFPEELKMIALNFDNDEILQ